MESWAPGWRQQLSAAARRSRGRAGHRHGQAARLRVRSPVHSLRLAADWSLRRTVAGSSKNSCSPLGSRTTSAPSSRSKRTGFLGVRRSLATWRGVGAVRRRRGDPVQQRGVGWVDGPAAQGALAVVQPWCSRGPGWSLSASPSSIPTGAGQATAPHLPHHRRPQLQEGLGRGPCRLLHHHGPPVVPTRRQLGHDREAHEVGQPKLALDALACPGEQV